MVNKLITFLNQSKIIYKRYSDIKYVIDLVFNISYNSDKLISEDED